MSDSEGGSDSLLQTRIKTGLMLAHRAELLQSRAFDEQEMEHSASLINLKQKSWVADASAASFASGFSYKQALRSAGGIFEKLLKPQSFSLDSITDSIARQNEETRRKCIRKVLPESLDWSQKNLTSTPVVNQGGCGSCYAVSSADAFTSRLRLKRNSATLKIRSAKTILQCSASNQGCSGGFPWLVAHHAHYEGLVSEDCAGPYSSDERMGGPLSNSCDSKVDICTSDVEYAKSWGYVGGSYGKGNPEDMMWSLYRDGPMVVAINAQPSLFMYREGLFVADQVATNDITKIAESYWEATTHAVALLGYGSVNVEGSSTDSWKLKNSWGPSWGEKGYFNIQRGSDAMAVESMAVHAIFGDGKPGNPEFESTIRAKLSELGDDSCTAVIEEMLSKELV